MIGAAVLILAGALAGFWAQSRRGAGNPAATAPTLAPAATSPALLLSSDVVVQNDASGAVTLVAGSDPEAVFRAFCRHPQWKSSLIPGGIQQTTPPEADRLLGSALSMDGLGTMNRVMLKRNPETKRWQIGDGTAAITLGHSSPTPPATPAN